MNRVFGLFPFWSTANSYFKRLAYSGNFFIISFTRFLIPARASSLPILATASAINPATCSISSLSGHGRCRPAYRYPDTGGDKRGTGLKRHGVLVYGNAGLVQCLFSSLTGNLSAGKLISIRWLSVPPEVSLNPFAIRHSASLAAFLTICC
jgi:hypothetical protein